MPRRERPRAAGVGEPLRPPSARALGGRTSGCTPRRTSRGSAGCRPTSPAGCRPPRRRERCSGRTTGPATAGPPARPRPAAAGELPGPLRQALDAFDEPAAQAALDRLVSDLSVTTVLRDVVLPSSPNSGSAGERNGQLAQEHFASNIIRGGSPGWPGAGGTGTAPAPSWRAPRRASRPGADGLRHRAQPQRVEDRLSRDEHPGRGADPDGRREAPDLVSWRRPCRRTSSPCCAAHRARPARSARPGRSPRHAGDRGRRGSPLMTGTHAEAENIQWPRRTRSRAAPPASGQPTVPARLGDPPPHVAATRSSCPAER